MSPEGQASGAVTQSSSPGGRTSGALTESASSSRTLLGAGATSWSTTSARLERVANAHQCEEMNQQIETKWLIFLLGLLIAVFGLLTRFQFDESLDIQIHDTYFVIHNTLLLFLIGFTLVITYLLTLGLRRLAVLNNVLKIMSISIAALVGLCFIGLAIPMMIGFGEVPRRAQYIPSYGILLSLFGLGVLFISRAIEMLKIE